jgi:hypothetical protein
MDQTINFRKGKSVDSFWDGFYYPASDTDRHLMQHLVNEDLSALNDAGMEKAKEVAKAHGWTISIYE